MKLRIAALLCLAAASACFAEVVRPAPDFRWVDPSGGVRGLAAFKGQPVVLLIAPDPRSWTFRRQLGRLRGEYERLAAQRAVFVVAFTREPGRVPSNIPFIVAEDGAGVGAAYGVERGSAIAVIGRDGNLDELSRAVLPGQRVLDIIINSFQNQKALRRL